MPRVSKNCAAVLAARMAALPLPISRYPLATYALSCSNFSPLQGLI
jgi:hypothetical protein